MDSNAPLRMAVASAGTVILSVLLTTSALAQAPLTPVIGLSPSSIDFERCTLMGECADRDIDVYNAVNDPTSILEVTAIAVEGGMFALVAGPQPPIAIPGDGSAVTFTVRFCPTDMIPGAGSFIVTAANAVQTPLAAPLSGLANHAPNCVAGGPYTAVVGTPIAFNGLGSGDPGGGPITSFEWTFGDGATASGPTPTHTYAAVGTYTATLTVGDDCGVLSTCETPVTITAEPINIPPVCDASGPYHQLPGYPVHFDGRRSNDPDGTIVRYAWDFGDGTTGEGSRPYHTYDSSGIYTVTLCVTDDRQATTCCTTIAEIGAQAVAPSTWGFVKSRYRD